MYSKAAAPEATQQSSQKTTAVFTCAYNKHEQQPGRILFCDNTAAVLTGLSRQKVLTCSFIDLCQGAPLLTLSDLNEDIQFRSELATFDGPPLLCDFRITGMYNFDGLFLQITVQPVSPGNISAAQTADILPINKLETLDTLSHGISHGINNSLNLITLSSDLLQEMVGELLAHFGPETPITIRGMDISELSKMIHQMTDNLLKSVTRINSISQALVQYLRGNVQPAPANYDIRKLLSTAVSLTEYEIHKTSCEFIYEPPQVIIRRTGDQYEILQAIFNCILFLCSIANGRQGRFSIKTTVRPEQNNFCIQLQHDSCTLSGENLNAVMLPAKQNGEYRQSHPLSVARTLISMNSGDLEVLHDQSGFVRIIITFSSVRIF